MLQYVTAHVGEVCLVAGSLLSLCYGFWWGPGVIGGTPLMKMPHGQRLFQFWVNLAGSGAGWIIVYSYLTRASLGAVAFPDLLLMLAGLIGILGFLPSLILPNASALMNAGGAWLKRLESPPTPAPTPVLGAAKPGTA